MQPKYICLTCVQQGDQLFQNVSILIPAPYFVPSLLSNLRDHHDQGSLFNYHAFALTALLSTFYRPSTHLLLS